MKKYLALVLALLLVLSCAACGEETEPTVATTTGTVTEPTTESTPDSTDLPEENGDEVKVATYIQLSICEEDGTLVSLTAFDDDNGQTYVEYAGAVKKIGYLDLTALEGISAELVKSGLMALDGDEVYEDGLEFASMYVGYTDETSCNANYGGTIPQTFRDGYAVMDAYFQQITAEIPEYVAEPVIMDGVNADAQEALVNILHASNAEPLDMFSISDVPMDDSFTAMMGLTKTDCITSGTSCALMMTSVAYACMVVTVEDESKIGDVAADFAANIPWDRWVCVSASNALIASKDNMVLCLTGSDDLFNQTVAGIQDNGWNVMETLVNE